MQSRPSLIRAPVPLLILMASALAPGGVAGQRTASPDRAALEEARKLLASRTAPADVAARMQRAHRQSAAQTAAIFRQLRAPARTAGPAVTQAYRLDGASATAALLDGGYPAPETVTGARAAGVRAADVGKGLATRRVRGRQVADAFRQAGLRVEDAVTALRGAGEEARPAAQAVLASFGGSAKLLAEPLKKAGYKPLAVLQTYKELGFSPAETAAAARADNRSWREAVELLSGLFALEDAEVGQALVDGGYTFEAPVIDRYRIADFRKGSGKVEGLGVVSPDLVSGSGRPDDGEVTIDGVWLDVPGTRARIVYHGGVAEGEVLSRSGGDGSSQIRVAFSGFRSGTLEVETLGGVASTPVAALSYHTVTAAQLLNPPSTLTLGGGGSLTWGFTTGAASISAPPSPANMELQAFLASSQPSYTVTSSSQWDLSVTATFPFTPQLTGSWTPEVEYWACESFKIPVAKCSTFDAACIADELGSAVQSAVACLNPANWSTESEPGPALPFAAQGAGVFALTANIRSGPSGLLEAPGTPAYTCVVGAADPSSAAVIPILQAWASGPLAAAVTSTAQDFPKALRKRLQDWQLILPELTATDAELIGVYSPVPGQVLLAFRH